MSTSTGNDGPDHQASDKIKEGLGYDLYPKREGDKPKSFMSRLVTEGRSSGRAVRCVGNVVWCVKNDPLVVLMLGALKNRGCPVNLSRHASCEDCKSQVTGGYDPSTNQVVICQNNATTSRVTCSVLAHELLHMYDYCRANVDFKNLEHLACTEIRAANFMHCSYMSALVDGDASPFSYVNKHRECVKRKALMSVLMVRNVSLEDGQKVVDKVFEKCYKDLEPFGRIPRRNSKDPERMLSEGYLYGYTDRMR